MPRRKVKEAIIASFHLTYNNLEPMDYPSDVDRLLTLIGWSTSEAARRLKRAPVTVRQWRTKARAAPPEVVAWCQTMAWAVERAGKPTVLWDSERRGRRPRDAR